MAGDGPGAQAAMRRRAPRRATPRPSSGHPVSSPRFFDGAPGFDVAKTVFIGHSAQDRLSHCGSRTRLRKVGGGVDVFVSSDLFDSIRAGDDWLERIIDRLRGCTVVVAILTPNATQSHWVHYEVGVADAGRPLVIPVTARRRPPVRDPGSPRTPSGAEPREAGGAARPPHRSGHARPASSIADWPHPRRSLSAVLREARRPILDGTVTDGDPHRADDEREVRVRR